MFLCPGFPPETLQSHQFYNFINTRSAELWLGGKPNLFLTHLSLVLCLFVASCSDSKLIWLSLHELGFHHLVFILQCVGTGWWKRLFFCCWFFFQNHLICKKVCTLPWANIENGATAAYHAYVFDKTGVSSSKFLNLFLGKGDFCPELCVISFLGENTND